MLKESGKRLLFFTAQSLRDLSSGAAVSSKTFCVWLASQGWQVDVLTTTGAESGSLSDIDETLDLQSLNVKEIDTSSLDNPRRWTQQFGDEFQRHFDQLIAAKNYDVALTYDDGDLFADCRKKLQEQNTRVGFSFHNAAYTDRPSNVDFMFAPSTFLADWYQSLWSANVDVVYPPIDVEQVLADEHERVCTTFVNPIPAKGLMVLIPLLKYFSEQRPDIPFLIVSSRGNYQHMVAASKRYQFDISRCENVFITDQAVESKEIYRLARVVIVPSIWEEPAGRLAIEAGLNAIPSIVSNRGGLPEIANLITPTQIIELPESVSMESKELLSGASLKPWFEAICRCYDDEDYYRDTVSRLEKSSRKYSGLHTAEGFERYLESKLSI